MAGVHYFLQEDRNKEVNFYLISSSSGDIVTLRDIKRTFPVKGNFHFRFRMAIPDSPPGNVWMEITDLDQPVPTFKGNFIVKALPLPPFTQAQAMARQRKVYKTYAVRPDALHVEEPRIPANKTQAPSQSIPSSVSQHPDIIDLRTPPKQPPAMFSMFPQAPLNMTPMMKPPQGKSEEFIADPRKGMTTEQLKAQKAAYIEENVAKKLEENRSTTERVKNMVDDKLKIGRELEERYKAWEERHSQKNNLRTLLSTLHTVLWQGADWRPLSPASLVLPKLVRKEYFKALQVVHPDHHQNDPAEIQFISERCYSALSEAWRRFQAEAK